MNKTAIIIIICLAFSGSPAAQAGSLGGDGRLAIPLAFTENRGQVHANILYYARTPAYSIGVTKQSLIFKDGSQLHFLGTSDDVSIEAAGRSASKANFFTGNDPNKWITGVNTYPAILYRGIYKGIDLKIYGNDRNIEYDWIVKPSADPTQIRFLYKNVKETTLDSEGNLSIETASNRLLHRRPVAYQIFDNKKITIEATFKKLKRNLFGFDIKDYNPELELIIDPLITRFATYLGGTGDTDRAYGLIVDDDGLIIVYGGTNSYDFPTASPLQKDKSSGEDCFICKIDPENSRLIFSTFLGGRYEDKAHCGVIGPDGSIYITGVTYAPDFPTKNPFQASNRGDADAFVLKVSSSGDQLLYSSYLGGSYYDSGKGIKVDEDENIYVTGLAWMNFPLKNHAKSYAGGGDAFVSKLAPGGQSLVYSTYVGGSTYDTGTDLIIGDDGSVVVTGFTRSANFPTVNGWQTVFGGERDSLLIRLSADGGTLLFSTLIGGNGDDHFPVMQKGTDGYYYLAGSSSSTNFPVKNAWQNSNKGEYDAIMACVDMTKLEVIFATYLGGSARELGREICLAANGRLILVGETSSFDFPTKNATQEPMAGGTDIFISQFSPQADTLEYSTYLGGTSLDWIYYNGAEVDKEGNLVLAGHSQSTDMEVMNPVQGANRGGFDVYVAKLTMDEAPSVEIEAPVDGDVVAGMVEIEIEAEDDVGVELVNVYIDDELLHTDRESPYGYEWDSSLAANGLRRIKAEAVDTMGFASTHEIEVQVRNAEIALAANRRDDRGWLVRKACGVLEFSVQKPQGLPIASYDIYRRQLSGTFQKVGSIPDSKPDLLLQQHRFIDSSLPSDQTCSYCIHAISDSGETVGISNACTL